MGMKRAHSPTPQRRNPNLKRVPGFEDVTSPYIPEIQELAPPPGAFGTINIDFTAVAQRAGLAHTSGPHIGRVNFTRVQALARLSNATTFYLMRHPEVVHRIDMITLAKLCYLFRCQPGEFLSYTPVSGLNEPPPLSRPKRGHLPRGPVPQSRAGGTPSAISDPPDLPDLQDHQLPLDLPEESDLPGFIE